MTIESLTLQLRVAGLLLIGLAFAHAFMPRQFKWAVELARLAPVNKSIFIFLPQIIKFLIINILSYFNLLFEIFIAEFHQFCQYLHDVVANTPSIRSLKS
jgi:hypothetical protein